MSFKIAAFALNIQKAQVPSAAILIKVLIIIANVISYPCCRMNVKQPEVAFKNALSELFMSD